MTYFNNLDQGRVGWRSPSGGVTPTTLWTSVYSVYNADSVGSSSLKTSLFAAYNGESNTNDSFGTNNGTPQGGLTYTTGKIGNAFTFNGSNSYVRIPNTSNQFNFTGDFSISVWINQTTDGNLFNNYYATSATNRYGYNLYLQGGRVRFATYNGNTATSSNIGQATATVINTNTWYQVVITKTTSNAFKMYINGVLQTLSVINGDLSLNPIYSSSNTVNIGAEQGISDFLNGRIDALNMWNRELTSSEITELYNSGNGAQYITDSFYKPTTSDALNTYNGTAQGGLTYGVGKVGTAFQFNGTTAYVGLPDNMFNTLTGDFTISLWVYPTAGTPQTILNNLAYTNGTIYKGWQLEINNISGAQSYKVTFTIGQGPGGSNYTGWEYSTTVLTPNAWNHILIKRVSGVNTYCWINNISQSYTLYGTGKDITLNPTYHTTQYNTIGSSKQLSGVIGNYLKNGSKVDGVTVWNKALTDDERTQIYNSGNGKQYPN